MSFDEPLTPAEVVETAGQFIVDAEVATPAAFEEESGTGGDAEAEATPEG